jgi:hypothetical protein
MFVGVCFSQANQVENMSGWQRLLNDEKVNEVLTMGHFQETH